MKKKIIVGLLMVSALSFGAVKNNSGNMQNNQMLNQQGMQNNQMMYSGNMMDDQMGMMNQMNNLTETQQKELITDVSRS